MPPTAESTLHIQTSSAVPRVPIFELTRPRLTPAEQHTASRAVWRETAALFAPHRDPFHMRLRSECLVRAHGGPDAEIAMPDGRTRLLGQIGGGA